MAEQRRTPGRRFYNQQQPSTSFRPTSTSVPFAPISAVDESKAIREQTKKRVEDMKTVGRAQKRQDRIDTGVLQAKQQIEKANFDANKATINGILQLSKTALEGYKLYTQDQEEKRQDQEALGFLLGGEGSIVDESGNTPQVQEGAQQGEAEQAAAEANENGVQEVAGDDPVLAEDVRQPEADQHSVERTRQISVQQATIEVTPYLSEFAQSNTLIMRPDGTTFRANEASNSADLTLVLQLGLRQFVQQNGLTGGDVRSLRDQFLPVARNALVQLQSQLLPQIQTANQDARIEVANEAISTQIQTGEYDVNSVWQQLATDYWNSGKFGGNRAKANEAALKALIQMAINQGDQDLLEALRDTPKFIHENGTAGPKLGSNPTYDALIQQGIREIKNNDWRDHTDTQREQSLAIERAQAEHQQALIEANGDPEKIREANQTLIDQTQEIGGPKAREIYQTITRQGLNYNPLVYGELIDQTANGEPPSADDVQELIDRGVITPQEGKAIIEAAGLTPEKARDVTKPHHPVIKRTVTGIIKSVLNGVGIDPNGEVMGAAAPMAADIEARMQMQLAQFMEENPNASSSQINQEIARLTQEYTAQLKEMKLDYKDGQVIGYNYTDPTPATVTTHTNPHTGQEARVLTGLDTRQLEALQTDDNKDNDLDAYNDRLLNSEEFETAVIAIANGDEASIPPRVKKMAEMLEMSVKNLVYAQGIGQGMDVEALIESATRPEEVDEAVPTSSNPQQEARRAMTYMQTALGVPKRGAAYLTGNIMQESSWNGQRDPWVLDDGAGTNKGLVSWNRDRITRIEQWSGKPIEEMTNREQMKAMLWEMKTYYKDAYRIFMNPRSTDAQLRRASMQYWGYGDEGRRFEFAQDYLKGGGRSAGARTSAPAVQTNLNNEGSSPNPGVTPQAPTIYIDQNSAANGEGGRQCFSAVSTMLANSMGVEISYDEYNRQRSQFGDTTSVDAQIAMLRSKGINVTVSDNGSVDEIARTVRSGKPVAIGINHNNGSGHWILVTGVTPEGDFIVNDPYGRLVQTRGGGWEYVNSPGQTGENVIYKRDFLFSVFEDRGPGTGRIMRA